VKMPNKPISEGYKIWALCDRGYCIDWRFHSRTCSVAELSPKLCKDKCGLPPSVAAVEELARCIPENTERDYVLYLDNLFTTIPLLQRLRKRNLGACGTARLVIDRFPSEFTITSTLPWNTVTGGQVTGTNGEVLAIQWEDNNHVHMLSTIHRIDERVKRIRKRPRVTSTMGRSVRRFFGDKHQLEVEIPKAIDDYNRFKGGVDIADQYRAYYFTQLISRRTWKPLFFWLLDTIIVNSFLIFVTTTTSYDTYHNRSKKRVKFSHKQFREAIAAALLADGYANLPKPGDFRRYVPKTDRVCFSKVYKDSVMELPPPAHPELKHEREHIARIECVRCRLRLRRQGLKTGPGRRGRAKRTNFRCSVCTFALCFCCFVEYHKPNGRA